MSEVRRTSGPAAAPESLARSGDDKVVSLGGAGRGRTTHAAGRTVWLLLGIACLAGLVWIHVYLVPMHLEEQPYVGWLFVLASVLLTMAILGLLVAQSRRWSWWAGAAVCVGMAVGYVASRTTGLPRGYHESWRDGWGTACLVLEAVYLLAMIAWWRLGREGSTHPFHTSTRGAQRW